MTATHLSIGGIPAILWGKELEKGYLFIHGKHGCKEAATNFAEIAFSQGWAVLSFDLPEHGERNESKERFVPWNIIPELKTMMSFAKERWNTVALRADSIGAWFGMQSYGEENLAKCLFLSPVLDMEQLIGGMMSAEGISREQLKKQAVIQTASGETLSWQYLTFAQEHPICKWDAPTAILWAENDLLTPRCTVDSFTARFGCQLTVMKNGEHWFHTPEQLAVLKEWTQAVF